MAIYIILLRFVKRIGMEHQHHEGKGFDILITGTFYSDNWLITHLRPLAMSRHCLRVRMVATSPVPSMDKVEAIYPPGWLTRAMGKVPARLMTFVWIGLSTRPHIVGGFHLLLNGLIAALLAPLIGSRSLYFCGGGPREVLGGGYSTENRLFRMLETPDTVVEKYLLKSVAAFDLVITMGTGAVKFFLQSGVDTNFQVIPGGFDGKRFYPSKEPPDIDLILIGRLSSVKRVDLFLQAVLRLIEKQPDAVAVIVGDGPDRNSLEQMANELGIKKNVIFVGTQHNIEEWLRRSKIFVLTSDSEGVSQAMIQAMLCGLPAVVSDVGDLGDLVQNGVNGYLISELSPECFSIRLKELLTNPDQLICFRKAAHHFAERFEIENVVSQWDNVFLNLQNMKDTDHGEEVLQKEVIR